MIAPPPPALESLPYGYQLTAAGRPSTVLADMDFETYSEAGWVWNEATQKWEKLPGTAKGKSGGLPTVGAAVYAEHPTTEILSLKYDLKDGRGRRHWRPGMAAPQDLFDHIAAGDLQRVLPEAVFVGEPIYIVYPRRRHVSPRLQAFLTFISELLRDSPAGS